MVTSYVPDRGDIIWVDFNPTRGHEQAGGRPAIVLSPSAYHKKSSLLIACPITTKVRGYPFEVRIKTGEIDGVILADQVKTIDWQERKVTYENTAPTSALKETTSKLRLLISG